MQFTIELKGRHRFVLNLNPKVDISPVYTCVYFESSHAFLWRWDLCSRMKSAYSEARHTDIERKGKEKRKERKDLRKKIQRKEEKTGSKKRNK